MYYIEFFRRRPQVSLEEFWAKTVPNFRGWSQREENDQFIGSLARTWRMGPHEHILIWTCKSFARLDEWDVLFHSSEVDDLEDPIVEVLEAYAAGFYAAAVPHEQPLDGSAYYVETFVPYDGVGADYARRAIDASARVALVCTRIGLLGPEPGGLAVVELDRLSQIEGFAANVPSAVTHAGTYVPLGREIL